MNSNRSETHSGELHGDRQWIGAGSKAKATEHLMAEAKKMEALRERVVRGICSEELWETEEDQFLEDLDTAFDAGIIDEDDYLDLCSVAFYDYCGPIPSYKEG